MESFTRIEPFEIALIIIAVILEGGTIAYVPRETNYLSVAISGMTTVASILSGLIVFLLNHTFSNIEKSINYKEDMDEGTCKKINNEIYDSLKNRAYFLISLLFFGLGMIVLGHLSMAEGNIISSFRVTLFSLILILILFIYSSLLFIMKYYVETKC